MLSQNGLDTNPLNETKESPGVYLVVARLTQRINLTMVKSNPFQITLANVQFEIHIKENEC